MTGQAEIRACQKFYVNKEEETSTQIASLKLKDVAESLTSWILFNLKMIYV